MKSDVLQEQAQRNRYACYLFYEHRTFGRAVLLEKGLAEEGKMRYPMREQTKEMRDRYAGRLPYPYGAGRHLQL